MARAGLRWSVVSSDFSQRSSTNPVEAFDFVAYLNKYKTEGERKTMRENNTSHIPSASVLTLHGYRSQRLLLPKCLYTSRK
jgi:hypothetical protein